MSFPVSETYRKDTIHKPGHGYGRKASGVWVANRGVSASSELIHSTNNSKPTKIWNEATFLRDSKDVSCHDLIAKDGTVYVILPDDMLAWHSGAALVPFTNTYSIGTELHVSVGEKPTQAQLDSLAWRIRQRRAKYSIVKERIDTHRAVALPKGRKRDPEGWSDAQFYAWRDTLFAPAEPDYAALWGTAAPYRANYAIPTAWRDRYRLGKPLGPALFDERGVEGGYTMQAFFGGYILWHPAHGTEVLPWRD